MRSRRVALVAALVTLALHLAANPHYGFFRDELYFIICGFHPAWGYVDQPPIVPLLSAGSQTFGHSLFALRAIPAIFAAGGAYVTVLLAFELGGGVFAGTLAALAYLAAPVLASFGMKVGPDMVGLAVWPLVALYLVRMANGADRRWWIAVGIAIGLAIESKYSVLFFTVATIAGLALDASGRAILLSRWFAIGATIATAVALPNFTWQAVHGFPMWELLVNGASGKNLVPSPGLFVVQQLLLTNVFTSPIWIAGLVWLLRTARARFLGYAYLILITMMIALHAKHYYPADVYPILMAAGGVAIEGWTRRAAIARAAIVAATVAAGLFFTPLVLPVLSEDATVRYAAFVGRVLHVPRSALATERGRTAALPEDFADMHGWPELAATVATIYYALPAPQRDRAAIVADNYGEAAAIDFFGPQYGLPPAISGHNNYWLWGTHGYNGDVVVDVNGDCGRHDMPELFRSARLAARFNAPWVISFEREIPISVCTGITQPLATLWPKLRRYI